MAPYPCYLPIMGRYIRIAKYRTDSRQFRLCKVEVYGKCAGKDFHFEANCGNGCRQTLSATYRRFMLRTLNSFVYVLGPLKRKLWK